MMSLMTLCHSRDKIIAQSDNSVPRMAKCRYPEPVKVCYDLGLAVGDHTDRAGNNISGRHRGWFFVPQLAFFCPYK